MQRPALNAPADAPSAERLAAPLPPLLVAADRVAATVAQGVHGRRRAGPGDAFWQFRRYQPGDPVRRIDWRRTARSPHVYVRETEWEAAQTVWLWRDASPSMAWRGARDRPEKGERATLLTLALAALLGRGGERAGLLDGGRQPVSGRDAATRLAAALDAHDPGHRWPEGDAVPRHAEVVLLSDFLAPVEDVAHGLRRLAGHGVRGHLVQVLDPAEESLPWEGRVHFVDPETGDDQLVRRVAGVRDAYARRLADHRAGLEGVARAAGWRFAVHHTDQPPQAALLTLYQALEGRAG